MARTPSRKWELNSNWLTAGKECGSILSSRLGRGEFLRDDSKTAVRQDALMLDCSQSSAVDDEEGDATCKGGWGMADV